jgi:tetratricopeptide (TPR) repeat protein
MARTILTLLLFVLSPLGTAVADADLAHAMEAYWKADYPAALAELQALDEAKLAADERVLLHKFLGLSLLARKDAEKAQEQFVKLLEIEPGYDLAEKEFSPSVIALFQKSRLVQAQRLYERGMDAYRGQRFQEAVPNFEQSLQLNPRNSIAKDFLALASKRAAEKKPDACFPTRAWAELDMTGANCQGVDYSSSFKLPVQANRLTLIYSKHHFGVGKCWKIAFFDPQGREIFVLTDPTGTFAGKATPQRGTRWRVVELPEALTIGKVKMYGEGGRGLEKLIGKSVGRDFDEFILGLELTCPVTP